MERETQRRLFQSRCNTTLRRWMRFARAAIFGTALTGSAFATELIFDGGFEQGSSNPYWSATTLPGGRAGSTGIIQGSGSYPHTGLWHAYLGDTSTNTFHALGSVHQFITIPSDAGTVTLTFYLNVVTKEVASCNCDKLDVNLRTASDPYPLIRKLVTYTEADQGSNANGAYGQPKTIDLTPYIADYKGQTILLQFYVDTDGLKNTIFRIDGVSVATRPVITSLATTPSPPTTGEAFTFTIEGNNFFPGGALISVTGPNCTPCTIPNSALTTKTTSRLVGPATLTAGIYSFVVQNGFNPYTGGPGPQSVGANVTVGTTETITTPGTITGEANPIQNVTYSYTVGTATSSLGHTVEYSFDWGDGNSSSFSTSRTDSHAWSSTGQKNIIVTARCQTHPSVLKSNSPGKSVTVTSQTPAPVAIIAGNLTPVTGSSTYYGLYSTGTGLTYSWTGNGQNYTSTNPSFSFNSPGRYTISLTVTDSSQRISTASIAINVQAGNNGITPGVALGADPVVLSAGNYIQSHTDLQLPGKGFPFEFKRFYNSKFSDQTGKPLGYGWTFNYNERVLDTGTNVLVIQGDGSTLTFFPTNNGYVGEQGVFDSLVHNTNIDNTWALMDKSQTVMRFSTNGQLSSITDKNGNALSLFYTNGILRQIQDTAGRSILLNTNALGCISDLTDPIGRTIRFEYDANTNLTAVVNANNQTNRYSYDASHQMTNAFDAKGTLYLHNEYNPTNFTVVKQHDAFTNWTYFSYDFPNRITYQTNVLGKVSIYSFDDRLLVTNILDEAGKRQIFSYDSKRNQIFIQDKNGNQTHYAYDALGNVTNKLDAANKSTSIQYSALNNPISRVDALTNPSTFGYDANGNLTATTNALGFTSGVQYNADGLPFILTDARGFSTTNQYDTAGNLVAIIDAKGFTSRFEHDAAGRQIRQIDALNRTNLLFYDNNDNLLYTVNALGFTNFHTYDANNNRTSSRNPRDATTTNIFDLKDRLVKIIAPLNQTVSNRFDALDRKTASFDSLQNPTTYVYDDIGNLIAVTNALSQVARFTYDPNGNQTSAIDPTNHYVTNFFDSLNRKVATIDISVSTNLTAYDALGRVIALTNANNQVTRFFYDAIGRLTNVVDAAAKSVFFDYDKNGNRIHTTDPNGNTWTNVFDEINRLVEQDDPIGHKTIFHYDPVGNLTNKLTPNGDSIFYFYDALNRLTNITYPSGPPVTFAYDEVGNRTNMTDSRGTTAWQYDLLNRLTNVTDPFNQPVTASYDVNGNRTRLLYLGQKGVNYGFDALNRMIAFTNWLGGVTTYGYDSRGNLIVATNANGTTASYAYDLANRLAALTNTAPNASIIAAYALTLDAVGNHSQATHNQPLFPILANQTNNYSYDSDNRLATIDGQVVTHNANGNLTGIGTNLYAYDFEDRLTLVSLANSSNSFSYDGLGNRLVSNANGQPRRFVLDRTASLTQVLRETDTNGLTLAYYVYGLGLAQRITPGSQVSTYHFNIQGSTVALTDSAGTITDSYSYDSFGVLANSDGDSPQRFRYLGRYGIIDDGTGFYYARARYFSPQLGRFLTKDPVTGKDSDGQSLNRYVYVLNNALRFIDPSGLTTSEGHFNTPDPDAAFGQLNFGDLPRELIEELLRAIGSRLELYVDTSYGRVSIGQLRLSPGNVIDLHGIGRTLRFTANASRVYGIAQSSLDELRARNVNFDTVGESLLHIDENLAYARDNPLEVWRALDNALTSYSAVFFNTYTLNLFQLRGDQIQRGVNAYVNFWQFP